MKLLRTYNDKFIGKRYLGFDFIGNNKGSIIGFHLRSSDDPKKYLPHQWMHHVTISLFFIVLDFTIGIWGFSKWYIRCDQLYMFINRNKYI